MLRGATCVSQTRIRTGVPSIIGHSRAIDATGIQFKLLNRSRGPAVWSPRAQADKKLYGQWVKRALDNEPNIEWLIGKAGHILVSGGRVTGIALEDGDAYACDALIVTTGTFLNGLIHIGA
jgi:tRNA uridine 5-carboxymethylaminomethyl modification enzyme